MYIIHCMYNQKWKVYFLLEAEERRLCRHSCDKCEFSANELAQIKRHKECKHKGTTSPATIKMYKTAKQKGKESSSPPQPEIVHYKYFCDHCDWGGNTLAVFKRHVKNRQGCQLQKINTSISGAAFKYLDFSTLQLSKIKRKFFNLNLRRT